MQCSGCAHLMRAPSGPLLVEELEASGMRPSRLGSHPWPLFTAIWQCALHASAPVMFLP